MIVTVHVLLVVLVAATLAPGAVPAAGTTGPGKPKRPPEGSGGRFVLHRTSFRSVDLGVLRAAWLAVSRRILVRVPRGSGVGVVLVTTAHARLVLLHGGAAPAVATTRRDAAGSGSADD
jgi:hypothetical protein